ncbi:MAG: 4-alpha-glucanotransferase [Hallerella porci]|uniref:4-alpha-glucanotransferase n=1 Tax=Hallerella TaxID=2815788 RepID=UPI000D0645DD|nr:MULTISPECIES: 4-alpha-glucanotransferase [Hallerella]MCI5601469.1 4-alpha-glucanotransferase [Hallerella sp.]MDY3922494.1 4-alpha-glucanotransferase [Hallerella porci]
MRYGEISSFQSGVAVPVFSLHSQDSVGIGEFLDLVPFGAWAKKCGLSIIQILPVNDTGFESSPYSARSAFALNPAFIRLQIIHGAEDFAKEISALQKKFAADPKVHYSEIAREKRTILRKIFDANYAMLEKNVALTKWIEANPWVKPYAVYAMLKEKNGESSWRSWKEEQNPTALRLSTLFRKSRKDALFQCWMQFEAEGQFKIASNKLTEMGVRLKGDIPILINEDSADVWFNRQYFSLDDRAGAPPDMFSYSGQNWGFPTYRWDVIESENFKWWKDRLAQASKFYHAYRIDHVLGFFRIWAIPQNERTGILGHFSPAIPLTLEALSAAGFKKETVEYLQRPNYSKDQLRGFLGGETDRCIGKFFELLPYSSDRYVFKKDCDCESAIIDSDEEQSVKDALLKVQWNRIFVPGTPANAYYPFWYWYNAPVLGTLPSNEQKKLSDLLHANEAAQENLWYANGKKLLSVLAKETDMVVCAEDLGAVPHCVPTVLRELQINSLRVERWARNWDAPYQPYYEVSEYPRLSVSTTSVHDTSTLLGLWQEGDFDKNLFWKHHLHFEGDAPQALTPDLVKLLIRNIFKSNSLFCIPPIQDYLALSSRWTPANPNDERVNTPGTVGPQNWAYKMPCSLEELADNSALSAEISNLTSERTNRSLR